MNDAKQATPPDELEWQICSAMEPKNEREWWAYHEIERLRARMAELERDAKLYRQLKLLLKTYGVDIAFPNSDDNGATDEWVSVSECSLDAAIDKAMEGE